MNLTEIEVLLIEDSHADIRLCRELLAENHPSRWNVKEALTLAEGLQQVNQFDFDVIALDLNLPDSRGLDTYRRLSEAARSVPVVILSGADDPETALEAVQAGAQDYLSKDRLSPYLIARAFEYAVERYQLKQQLRDMAITDDLSGLLNRRGFFRMAEHQILLARRSLENLALFFVDIDGLKNINDHYGYRKGDAAIQATAEVLRRTFRESDLIARLGGDEFAGMAVGTGQNEINIIQYRLQEQVLAVEEEFQLPFSLSLSVGTSIWDLKETQDLDLLLHQADRSMYARKEGRSLPSSRVITEENFQEQPPFQKSGLELLLVEDNPGDARLVEEYLSGGDPPVQITKADRISKVRDDLLSRHFSVILLDLNLPDSHGVQTIRTINQIFPDTPVVVFTGQDNPDLASRILQSGVQDYLVKGDFNDSMLQRSLQYAVERHGLRRQNQTYLEELQHSEHLLQSIFDHVTLGIFRTDARGKILFANQALINLLGYDSLAEMQKVNFFDNHLPGHHEIDPSAFGKMPSAQRISLVNLHEEEIPVRLTTSVNSVDNSTIIQGTVENISRQLASEQQLELQATALNAAANAIVITDPQGKIRWVNQAFSDLTGYETEELIGRNPRILKSGEQDDEFYQLMWETITSGRVWQGQMVNRRKNGTLYTERMTITPLMDDQGRITHYIAVQEDITSLEENQRILKRRLEEVTTLGKVAAAGIEEQDENALIAKVTAEVGRAFFPDHFGILLMDQSGNSLSIHPTYQGLPEDLERESFSLGEGIIGHVAQTREMVLLGNASEDKRYVSAEKELHSELCVPLIADDRVIGVINAESRLPNAFSEEDARLLNTIAGQLATAISRIRYTREEQEQRQIAETLSQIAVTLNSTLDIDRVLDQFLESIAALIPYESASLVLYHAGRAQVLRHRGYEEKGLGEWIESFEFDQYASTEQDIRQGKVELVKDAREDDDWIAIPETEWVRSYLGVPIIRENEVIGIINLDHSTPNFFQEKHIPVVRTLANQVATALENADLYRQQQRQVDFLESLRQIDFAITGSLDLKVTLEVIMMEVMNQLQVDAVNVLLYDSQSYLLTPTAHRGFKFPDSVQPSFRSGEGLAGKIVQTRKPILIPDLDGEENLPRQVSFQREGFQGYYGLPLVAKGKIAGVMEVFRHQVLEPEPEWTHYMETVGTQTAIAVDNSQLFQDLQQANRELSLAYDTTLEGWAGALELRDHETEGHSRRVVGLTMELVKTMNIPREKWIHIRRGALLHDIGKMGVPDSILQKDGELTEGEWQEMRQHPLHAQKWLQSIAYLKPALDIPLYHHERWDGTGYPFGLQKTEIPLAARIFAIVDVWDALRSDRPYRKAWSREQTLKHIREESGAHFDPQVVETFLEVIEQ